VSEAHLIARVLAGDRIAGRELYDAHAPRVYRLAFRMTRDEELARECTQDAFVTAFAKLSGFRQESALGTWLHRITVSTVLQALRSRKRHAARFVEMEFAAAIPADDASGDVELTARLERALEELPEMYRVAFVMHDLEGYTHAAIAETLAIPEGTSKTRVASARARLREVLAAVRDR
jgi:RNA polymerase sigma-70 factor (ECF subfamily)